MPKKRPPDPPGPLDHLFPKLPEPILSDGEWEHEQRGQRAYEEAKRLEAVRAKRKPVRLHPLSPSDEEAVLKGWAEINRPPPAGEVGYRSDDSAANLLLQAAEILVERRDWSKAETILKLVVSDFRGSAEASLALSAIGNLDKYK